MALVRCGCGKETDWHLRLPSVAFGMEHASDPRDYLEEDSALWSACPAVWRTQLVKMLAEIMEFQKYDFDQAAYGIPVEELLAVLPKHPRPSQSLFRKPKAHSAMLAEETDDVV